VLSPGYARYADHRATSRSSAGGSYVGRIMRFPGIVACRGAIARQHVERLIEDSLRLNQLHAEMVMRAQFQSLVPPHGEHDTAAVKARTVSPRGPHSCG
jgi:hypothetical protein